MSSRGSPAVSSVGSAWSCNLIRQFACALRARATASQVGAHRSRTPPACVASSCASRRASRVAIAGSRRRRLPTTSAAHNAAASKLACATDMPRIKRHAARSRRRASSATIARGLGMARKRTSGSRCGDAVDDGAAADHRACDLRAVHPGAIATRCRSAGSAIRLMSSGVTKSRPSSSATTRAARTSEIAPREPAPIARPGHSRVARTMRTRVVDDAFIDALASCDLLQRDQLRARSGRA